MVFILFFCLSRLEISYFINIIFLDSLLNVIVLIKVLETKYNSIYIIIAFYCTEIYSSSDYKNIAYIL